MGFSSPREGGEIERTAGSWRENEERLWKDPSHAWDTVLSPAGDVDGSFRGWLRVLHGSRRI